MIDLHLGMGGGGGSGRGGLLCKGVNYGFCSHLGY